MGWVRRHARAGVLFAAAGCMSSGGSGTCDPTANGGLGQGHFYYVCGNGGATSPGFDPDAWCDSPLGVTAIPDVVVGAPFRVAIDQPSTGGPQPAVASLAQSTPQGWSLVNEGWLGFIAWSGSDVIDFTHVHGQPVASLAWEQPMQATLPESTIPVLLAVVPRDGNGVTLGGSIACTFAVSDLAVLGVSGTGRIASVVAIGGGDATLTAACGGREVQTSLHVDGATSAQEGGTEDASDDQGAGSDGSFETPFDGSFEAAMGGESEAPGDAAPPVDGGDR